MREIIHAVTIDAAPSAVYGALTTAAGLTGWWTKRAAVEEGEGGVRPRSPGPPRRVPAGSARGRGF